jgi:predicted PilT family ATPase
VGKAVVAALQHPEAAMGKALKVQSFVVTPHQVLNEIEMQTKSSWSTSYTSLEELRKLETKFWEEKSPFAVTTTLRRIWTEGGTLYEANDNDMIGLEPKDMDSLEVAVRRVLPALM